MKILVTGGAGFIASHLVDRLINEGYEVVVIDNLSTGSEKNLNPKSKFYKIDIQDEKIEDIFKKEKPNIVFHYAAQIDLRKSVEDPEYDARINILGSLNIFENCRKYDVEKIIFASTGGAIYGDVNIIPTPESHTATPVSPYGVAKLSVESYLYYYYKVHNISFVTLRFSNVYGPRQNSKGESGVIAIFIDKILSGEQPIIYGDGNQTRDYIFVKDVIDANILSLNSNKIGVFNIGTSKEVSVNEVLKLIKKVTKSSVKETHIGAKIGELKRSSLDCSKIKKELGWEYKYDIEGGLKETTYYGKDK